MKNKNHKKQVKGKVTYLENVEYTLKDKFGNVKKMFHENWLYDFLMKQGFLSPSYYKTHSFLSLFLGSWQDAVVRANLITSAGKAGAASRLNGSGGEAAFTYIALGIGTTAADVADTTLESEITTAGGQRANSTVSRVTTTVTNDTAQELNTFTFSGSFAITESGVLNAASAGTLLAHQVFAEISVVSGDTLQITWKLAVGSA